MQLEQAPPPEQSAWKRWIFPAATAAALLIGLYRTVRLWWVCDDAFITFRYIDNMLAGHGLVYNVGERVEGYTHLLWLMIVALFRWLGGDPVEITKWLGLLSFTGTLGLAAWVSHRLFRGAAAILPLTALLLALNHDFAIWATGGLETSMFTLLVLAATVLLSISRGSGRRSIILGGLLLGLAILARPDAAILYPVAALFVVGRARAARPERGEGRKALLLLSLPFAAVLLPWLVWKIAYYGQILPNTYYAKLGGSTYLSQGFRYVWLYAVAYLSFLLAFPAIAYMAVAMLRAARRDPQGGRDAGGRLRSILEDPTQAFFLLAASFFLSYLILFVIRVGGDFMYARFLIPLVPLGYMVTEIALRRAIGPRRRLLAVALVALPFLLFYEKERRNDIYYEKNGEPRSTFGPMRITDEHWYYTHDYYGRNLIDWYRRCGRQLSKYFKGQDVRVLLGGQASLGYYGRFAVCIEAAGLTDPYIARLPVRKRARPGHEKEAPPEYLVRRGVNFIFMVHVLDPHQEFRTAHFRIESKKIRAQMITYNRELMRHLKRTFPEDVEFVDFEEYLDEWLAALPAMPLERVRADYATFKDFYFLHNEDPERERPILARLEAG